MRSEWQEIEEQRQRSADSSKWIFGLGAVVALAFVAWTQLFGERRDPATTGAALEATVIESPVIEVPRVLEGSSPTMPAIGACSDRAGELRRRVRVHGERTAGGVRPAVCAGCRGANAGHRPAASAGRGACPAAGELGQPAVAGGQCGCRRRGDGGCLSASHPTRRRARRWTGRSMISMRACGSVMARPKASDCGRSGTT